MTEPTFSLHLTADLHHLAAIRQFVRDKAGALNVTPDAIDDLVLAVDEAVTNIIVHGYCGGSGALEIDIRREGQAIAVHLRDQAPLFDPTSVPPPDLSLPLDQRPLGKMGLYLVRDTMDDLVYRVTPQGGNELILLKRQAIKG
jgi:serine/threonine-protein kinase RsbW